MCIGLLIEERNMNRRNQGDRNTEIEIDASDVKRPRKTAPKRGWVTGVFVALVIAALAACGSIDHRSDHAREARFNKDATLEEQGKHEEELAIHEALDQDSSPDERAQTAIELLSKGATLGEQGKTGEALAVYEEVDRRFGQDISPDVREVVVLALLGKGAILVEQGKIGEALAVFEEIERRFGQDTSPGMREKVARALSGKGVALREQGKIGEVLAVYEEIDRRFGQDASPGMRKLVALVLFSKGAVLWRQGNIGEVLAVYGEIERRFGQDTSLGVLGAREQLAKALVNKGEVLWRQGKIGEALAVYEEVDRRFGQDTLPGVRKQVVMALVNKAGALFEFRNDVAGSLAVLDSVLARCRNSPEPALQAECDSALRNSVGPLLVLGKTREAAQSIRQVQAQLAADDRDSAIMAFLLWLAEPQTSEQTVRKTIRALPPDVQSGWTFDGIHSFILNLPAPRKAQGQCFLDFFEQHHDAEKLDVCLN
jgi:tetratricopeptide (TPR) repeat protein